MKNMPVIASMNSKISDDTDSITDAELTTIEETFSKYSIPQIQQLTKKYKSKADTAKLELYDLVGSKYRDLIKIAEDIGDMYANSREINSKLSDLSYSPSRFVPFDSNPYTSYSTQKRIEDAQRVREKEKITILNILINDELLHFQMRLESSPIPFTHTSFILHYAKLFCTIEHLFADILEDKEILLSKRFFSVKNAFLSYLEREIAMYNPLSNSLYSTQNDALRNTDLLQIEDIVNTHEISIDKVNSYLDDGDIYIEELPESDVFFGKEYNRTLNPFVHFLSSYLILNYSNNELNTLPKIFERFSELRSNYFKSLIEFALKSNSPTFVDFSKAIKYVENTLQYSAIYFGNTENELIHNIKSNANSWNGTSVISYHSWFLDANIDLGFLEIFQEATSKDMLDEKANELVTILFDFVLQILRNETSDILSSASIAFMVIHNFVYCLQVLNNKRIENGLISKLVEVLLEEINAMKLPTLFKEVKEIFIYYYNKKISELNCEINGISSNLTQSLETIGHKEIISNPLFSEELLELMDSNINEYLNSICKFSMSLPSEEVGTALIKWFETLIRFRELLTFNENADFNTISASNSIEHIAKVLDISQKNGTKLPFHGLTKEKFISDFHDMSSVLVDKLSIEINIFINHINDILHNHNKNDNVEEINLDLSYYILRLLLIVKEKVIIIDGSSEKWKDTLSRLDELIRYSYEHIFEITKLTPYIDDFTKFLSDMDKEIQIHMDIVPLRPSLMLSSLMYNFCTQLVSLKDQDIGYEIETLFINNNSTELYRPVKNDWIINYLVNESMLSKLDAVVDKSRNVIDQETTSKSDDEIENNIQNKSDSSIDRNDKEVENGGRLPKDLSSIFLQAFADIAFLVQFTNPDRILNKDDESIKLIISKLYALGADTCLNETTINFIFKGIYDFFKSNKGLYLPLLI